MTGAANGGLAFPTGNTGVQWLRADLGAKWRSRMRELGS